jgi:hypothetical protein
MNLRILKKLSKRAAPLLARLGDARQQFRAELHDNYMKCVILDRTCFERMRSKYDGAHRQGEVIKRAKDGNGFIRMYPPHHPLPGTIMVGAVSGYYEPEWDEETAWDALCQQVYWSFVDYSGGELLPTRKLRTPTEIFRAAQELTLAGR